MFGMFTLTAESDHFRWPYDHKMNSGLLLFSC